MMTFTSRACGVVLSAVLALGAPSAHAANGRAQSAAATDVQSASGANAAHPLVRMFPNTTAFLAASTAKNGKGRTNGQKLRALAEQHAAAFGLDAKHIATLASLVDHPAAAEPREIFTSLVASLEKAQVAAKSTGLIPEIERVARETTALTGNKTVRSARRKIQDKIIAITQGGQDPRAAVKAELARATSMEFAGLTYPQMTALLNEVDQHAVLGKLGINRATMVIAMLPGVLTPGEQKALYKAMNAVVLSQSKVQRSLAARPELAPVIEEAIQATLAAAAVTPLLAMKLAVENPAAMAALQAVVKAAPKVLEGSAASDAAAEKILANRTVSGLMKVLVTDIKQMY